MHIFTNNQASGKADTSATTANWHNRQSLLTCLTKRSLQLLSGGLAISSCWLLTTTMVLAGSFSFTKFVDTRSDFSNVLDSAAINDNGTIAFIAAPNSTQTGVYVNDGTGITELINSNALLPFFKAGSQPSLPAYRYLNINNKGTVAFVAGVLYPSSQYIDEQIFVGQDGSFTRRSPSFSAGRNYGDILIGSAMP